MAVRFSPYDVTPAGYAVNYFGDKGLGLRGVYVIIPASEMPLRGILPEYLRDGCCKRGSGVAFQTLACASHIQPFQGSAAFCCFPLVTPTAIPI